VTASANDDTAALLYKDPANDREAMEGPEGKHWWDGLLLLVSLFIQQKGIQSQSVLATGQE
jgi:hypothetical protein